jgi:hypothetical protein
MSFSKKYVFTHLHLFEWKTMFRVFCELTWMNFFNMELKQYNQLIFNIWLSTSTSLVIVWMVFGVYLHFVVYWYDYIFFMNIYFNHLISISKQIFLFTILFLGFWTTLFQVQLAKNPFNNKVLVEVQTHEVSKNNFYSNNLWSL